ncbi:hypothetical protein ACI3KY_04345 [Microbacterium sp. ZW T2_14]
MLDVLYLAMTLALFALVGLIAVGVDRLGRHSRPAASRDLSRKAR